MMRFKLLQNYTAKNKQIMTELDELISNCQKIYSRLILLKHNLPREEDEKVRLKSNFIYRKDNGIKKHEMQKIYLISPFFRKY
jgi:hypothetical protein